MRALAALVLLVLAAICLTAAQRRPAPRDPVHDLVAALPAVDRVDVLSVYPFQIDDPRRVDCTRRDVVCAAGAFPLSVLDARTLTGKDAVEVALLWRQLSHDTAPQDDCFSADRVVRFYRGERLLLEAEVCTYCDIIWLPNAGALQIEDDTTARRLQQLLNGDLDHQARFAIFRQEMLPHVGHQVSIVGILRVGKQGEVIPYRGWEIDVYPTGGADKDLLNALSGFGCHTVRATGILRHFPEPKRWSGRAVPAQVPPEHFFLDTRETKILDVSPAVRSR